MPSQIAHKHHDEIDDKGFTLLKGFLTPEEVETYKESARKVVELARKGDWSEVRTRGKQFPPWPKNFSPDIWGISGLLNPKLGDLSLPFQECYSSSKMLDVVCDILQTNQESLSMELFNMLINPLTDFGLDWHRDHIKPEATEEEEREELQANPFAGAQFNLALTDDECLIVVPGSHKRVRTSEEREKTIPKDRQQHISGQITVKLSPGDMVFYNSNILHRAQYSAASERLTLHGSYGHKDFGKFRAKGVLQHGVASWIHEFKPINSNLEMLWKKLVALSEEFKAEELGYSLEG